jgi:hypothetical protein
MVSGKQISELQDLPFHVSAATNMRRYSGERERDSIYSSEADLAEAQRRSLMICVANSQNETALDRAMVTPVKHKGYIRILKRLFEKTNRATYWSDKRPSSRSKRPEHPPVCEVC